MRQLILTVLTLAFFLLVSCTTNKVDVLTEQDKATIQSELETILKQIVENSEAGNFEKATEAYADSPEFISINNAVITDSEGFLKSSKDFFDIMDYQKFNETTLKFTFIDKKTVILTYGGSALTTMKDGQQMNIDPFSAVLVFRKIGDSWKVIHSNETATIIPIAADSTTLDK